MRAAHLRPKFPDAARDAIGVIIQLGGVGERDNVLRRGLLETAEVKLLSASDDDEQIANALPAKRAGHPSSAIFLTADAFGILPPIARLTRDQAMYWFLSGFTAKLAGKKRSAKKKARLKAR